MDAEKYSLEDQAMHKGETLEGCSICGGWHAVNCLTVCKIIEAQYKISDKAKPDKMPWRTIETPEQRTNEHADVDNHIPHLGITTASCNRPCVDDAGLKEG